MNFLSQNVINKYYITSTFVFHTNKINAEKYKYNKNKAVTKQYLTIKFKQNKHTEEF